MSGCKQAHQGDRADAATTMRDEPRRRRERRVGSAFTQLTPGAVVAGQFRVRRRIAAGAMGEVWEAEHRRLRIDLALKVLLPEVRQDAGCVARFSREARLLGQVHSDHVVRAYDFVCDGRYGPALAMELVAGPSLAEVIASRRFTVEEGVELGIEVATALREIHEARIVHRDVKPANILLRPLRGGLRRAVLVDLGVSRRLPDPAEPDEPRRGDVTGTESAVGTPEYMAPEQILSSSTALPSADLYALGAILFLAVSGHHVFDDVRGNELLTAKLYRRPGALVTGRSDRRARGFEQVVARALAAAPADRYADAEQMLAELTGLRDATATGARGGTCATLRANVARSSVAGAAAPATPPPRSRQASPQSVAWQARRGLGLIAALAAGTLMGGLGASYAAAANPQASDRLARDLAPAGTRCSVVAGPVESAGGGHHFSLTLACDDAPAARGDGDRETDASP